MDTILELLFDASLRTIIIAAAVGCILRTMRVKSPAVAHRAWTGVLPIMLFLPVLSLWAPRMSIPILPATSFRQAISKPPPALSSLPSTGKIAEQESARMEVSGESGSPMSDPMRKQSFTGSAMLQTALVVYLIGFCFFAVRLLTGMLLSYKLGRNAQMKKQKY